MAEPNLFTTSDADPGVPLAARMRPRTLAEFVGQDQVTQPGAPLRSLLGDRASVSRASFILWGPPGSGKTSLATLIANSSGDQFVELSAVTAGVKDVREAIDKARLLRELNCVGTVLFVDEVHRFSKTQQDALLPAVENGWVRLVAATTENPSFAVISPLMSRCLLVPLQPVPDESVLAVVKRALADERGLAGRYRITDQAGDFLVRLADGDVRRALTILEAAAGESEEIGIVEVENAAQTCAPRYDATGTEHYDVASALIKSIRGSDVDAALHYLARMIVAGEDPRFIARRLVIAASEDIGLADSNVLNVAVSAMHAVNFVGMPEARITLGHAVVALAVAPKSNRAYEAMNQAIADVQAGLAGPVPAPLRDGSTAAARQMGSGTGYRYPHDHPAGLVEQRYAPDSLGDRIYYHPSGRGDEADLVRVVANLRKGLGRAPQSDVHSEPN